MVIRLAKKEDLPAIVKMLTNDFLGSQRERFDHPLPDDYLQAFDKISSDPNQELMVVTDNQEVIGTFQLSFIPYLTYLGGVRAQLEAVRIKSDRTGTGIGQFTLKWVINRAKEKGAHLLQLTTDKQRPEALRFYKKLGFVASHEGLKLHFN